MIDFTFTVSDKTKRIGQAPSIAWLKNMFLNTLEQLTDGLEQDTEEITVIYSNCSKSIYSREEALLYKAKLLEMLKDE